MGLLLVRPGSQLHHRGPVGGQSQQDALPVGPLRGHLRLGREHQVLALGGSLGQIRVVQERQPGQTEAQPGSELGPEVGELGQLTAAVHHEQVTTRASADRPAGGRDADPGQPGHQQRPARAPHRGRVGESAYHRAGAGEQHDIWAPLGDESE